MYLTAQRVQSAQGAHGINAFQYLHGPYVWQGLPPQGVPDQNPGTLVAQAIVVPPPGNRVQSYLDLVAPDETSWSEIRAAFITFISAAQRQPLPWVGVFGRCFFRINMDRSIAIRWSHEIADLYRAIQAVRIGG